MSRVTEADHELAKEVTKWREFAKKDTKNPIFFLQRRLAVLIAAAPTELSPIWYTRRI
jgi:hypothetical protein